MNRFCLLFVLGVTSSLPLMATTPTLASAEGHVNFLKRTGPSDDVYTTNPSPSTVSFMNRDWTRLITFSGYWNQGNKLSWYGNAWSYLDSYAIYSDPANTLYAPLVTGHPDWILRDVNGNPLYVNYDCSNGTCSQYAANLTNPAGFRAWWISQAQTLFSQAPPFRGIFIDDVNLDLSCVSDGYGNPVTPVDPTTGTLMTNAVWRQYFADFMTQVRAALPAVELTHNSIWFWDWSDPAIQRQIQQADWINVERGVNDGGLTGGTGTWSLYRLLSFIDFVHSYGKGVVLDAESALPFTDSAREYSVASYLLISTGKDMVGDNTQTPSTWWGGFDTDLGSALGIRYVWQALWRRDFAGGMTLVNPPGSPALVVTLPAPFVRIDGSIVNGITLNAGEGAVLRAFPAITSVNPNSATAGGTGFTLTVNGANFTSDATVQWNTTALPTTVLNATQVTAAVHAGLIAAAGTANITVTTSTGSSPPAAFTVSVAPPIIQNLNPNSATAGGPGFTLTVNGVNFTSSATVQWGTGALATTVTSATQVTAVVPASLISVARTASISVITASGTSAAASFTINPSGTATLLKLDTVTQGNWKGVYGSDGYNIINEIVGYPAYVKVTPSGNGSWTWASSTSDVRALSKASSSTDRIAATWYSSSSFLIDLAFTDGGVHQVALYCVDWDSTTRIQTVSILDASGTVLSTQSLGGFHSGGYLVWQLSGHVKIKATSVAGANAVASGLLFGTGGATANTATFYNLDTATQGNWKGVYGRDGYNIINDTVAYPAYVTVAPSGNASWTWASSTTDVRALNQASSSTDRVAATWYSSSSFVIDLSFTDAAVHQVAVYCLDWDFGSRAQTLSILDTNGRVLNTQTLSGFQNGSYLVWQMSGHVRISVSRIGGPNAVVSGLFFK
jgi:putative glycosyl hydrolase-like family 15 (GHL15) protein/IPT/TIG domain-containing protein